MAEVETPEAGQEKKKGSKLPLLIGLLLMLLGGGVAFYATYSGMLLGGGQAKAAQAAGGAGGHGSGQGDTTDPLPDIAFVPVAPLVISLGPASHKTHLRFGSQLEVARVHEQEVAMLMPRILDVLNGYLRAVEVREIEDPAALIRLRAQMLRRIQIVTGEGRVRDLLVTEFVLN